MSMNVKNFKHYGNRASYHFADDSAVEWDLGYVARDTALKIFDGSSREEQEAMREIAKDFLWGSEFSEMRPVR